MIVEVLVNNATLKYYLKKLHEITIVNQVCAENFEIGVLFFLVAICLAEKDNIVADMDT